jgi:hypothetical protein
MPVHCRTLQSALASEPALCIIRQESSSHKQYSDSGQLDKFIRSPAHNSGSENGPSAIGVYFAKATYKLSQYF